MEISYPELRLAIAEMVIALVKDLENRTGMPDVDCRMIYHAAMIGTLSGRPMTVSKLAYATGLSRSTVRRHLGNMRDLGAIADAPGGAVVIVPGFANGENIIHRMRVIEKTVKRTCEAFHSLDGQNGH